MIKLERSFSTIFQSEPFKVELFSTEWDGWCDHRVPFINAKFGRRPKIALGEKGKHWVQWDNKLLEQTVQKNSVLYLRYGSFDIHIDSLFDACRTVDEPRIVVSDTKIRSAIPENVRVIYVEPLAYQFSRTFADTNIKPVYHRQVKDLTHPFMIMSRSADHGRPRLMLMLEQLGLLKDALYSCGDIQAADHLFDKDELGINKSLKDVALRTLGSSYIKMDVKKNLEEIPALINQCHFYVGADTNGLFGENMYWPVNEKCLWGYATTVPVLPIWYDNVNQQMQEWGYRFKNIPYQQLGETVQQTVARWCCEILFYYQIAQNAQWSQSWQDQQGEDAVHNFELTRVLYKTIAHDIEQQIDELPSEFQNLQ